MDGYLDTEVAHRALELRMAQEELHSAQVPGSSIDERRLGAANGMVQSVAGSSPTSSTMNPQSVHTVGCSKMGGRMNAAREKKVVGRKT
jgi:hypothetical protein